MMGKTNAGGGMPSGLAMMIKTFLPGFDPVELVNRVIDWQADAQRIVGNFDARLKALEDGQQKILAELRREK